MARPLCVDQLGMLPCNLPCRIAFGFPPRRCAPRTAPVPGHTLCPVTERKPSGFHWESWVDRQIREAQERGEFDNLPGAGKPIPGIDRPYDEMWWVKQKLASEGVSFLPPALALRKEVDNALERVMHEGSEGSVRAVLDELNARIKQVNRTTISGPPTSLWPVDVERMVERWRASRILGDQGTI
jgi:hypothetical protein